MLRFIIAFQLMFWFGLGNQVGYVLSPTELWKHNFQIPQSNWQRAVSFRENIQVEGAIVTRDGGDIIAWGIGLQQGSYILHSANGGFSWNYYSPPSRLGSVTYQYACFSNQTVGFVVGIRTAQTQDLVVSTTTDGGNTWNYQTFSIWSNQNYYDYFVQGIACTNQFFGFFVYTERNPKTYSSEWTLEISTYDFGSSSMDTISSFSSEIDAGRPSSFYQTPNGVLILDSSSGLYLASNYIRFRKLISFPYPRALISAAFGDWGGVVQINHEGGTTIFSSVDLLNWSSKNTELDLWNSQFISLTDGYGVNETWGVEITRDGGLTWSQTSLQLNTSSIPILFTGYDFPFESSTSPS